MIRRILDYFGLASYPAQPRIPRRADLNIGVNVHIDGSSFDEIAAAGFNTVILDWGADLDQAEFSSLLSQARALGLRTFTTGFPKDGGPIAEQARELFSRHGAQIDFCAVRNEPDLARFYGGTVGGLSLDIQDVWAEKRQYAPHVKIVAPCLSSLGSSSRLGVENVIRGLAGRHYLAALPLVDIIGQHIYRDTPDAVLRYYRHIRRVYREAGWTQKFWISETGWRSPRLSQERQATYLVNTLAALAKEPDISGVGIYVLNDDVSAKDFFGIRGKKAFARITECLR